MVLYSLKHVICKEIYTTKLMIILALDLIGRSVQQKVMLFFCIFKLHSCLALHILGKPYDKWTWSTLLQASIAVSIHMSVWGEWASFSSVIIDLILPYEAPLLVLLSSAPKECAACAPRKAWGVTHLGPRGRVGVVGRHAWGSTVYGIDKQCSSLCITNLKLFLSIWYCWCAGI